MAEAMYVVTFDVSDPRFNVREVKDLIRADDNIHAWWNHIPGVFFMSSDLGPKALSRRLQRHVGDIRFLAVEVRPERMGGYLPERSWQWFRRRLGGTANRPELDRSA